MVELALRDLASCIQSGDWSDPTPSMELEPPAWMLNALPVVHDAA
jgi:hypothetical protein